MCVCVCAYVCVCVCNSYRTALQHCIEFGLQSCDHNHFWTHTLEKGTNLIISTAMNGIAPVFVFYKIVFSIK